MCGIAGIARWDGAPTAADVAAVLAMLDAEAHRGPDDWGLLLPRSLLRRGGLPPAASDPERVLGYDDDGVGPHVVLGARRLAILDRSARGRMPMGDPEARRFIVHNVRGEDVDTSRVMVDAGAPTGIFLKEISGVGTTTVYYYRHGSAASRMRPEDLDVVPDPSRIRHLFEDEGVFGPRARAVEQFYAGKTQGWFLGHLALTHPREHVAQALLVRKLQGLGTGRR